MKLNYLGIEWECVEASGPVEGYVLRRRNVSPLFLTKGQYRLITEGFSVGDYARVIGVPVINSSQVPRTIKIGDIGHVSSCYDDVALFHTDVVSALVSLSCLEKVDVVDVMQGSVILRDGVVEYVSEGKTVASDGIVVIHDAAKDGPVGPEVVTIIEEVIHELGR